MDSLHTDWNALGTLPLHVARDRMMSSSLAVHCAGTDWPDFNSAIRYVVECIDRLERSCHLQEFTDHGLPHLLSLVDRIAAWETLDEDGSPAVLAGRLSCDEAAVLLFATLIHDVGMLSQSPNDLPSDAAATAHPDLATDFPTWVRQTHVTRLPALIRRVLAAEFPRFGNDERFELSLAIAQAHQVWPWRWQERFGFNAREAGLAAIVSVADLLDEDAQRCDTQTLLDHRHGTVANKAHWMRHALTKKRLLIQDSELRVELLSPPNISESRADTMRPLFGALRNHFRLVRLYDETLSSLGAQIRRVHVTPGVPDASQPLLNDWKSLPDFDNEYALSFHLMNSIMPEARGDSRFYDQMTARSLEKAELEEVDLKGFLRICNRMEPRAPLEECFYATIGWD